MKIAIICQNYPPAIFEGGISHYSRLLAENLSNRGHEVYALTSTEFTHLTKESAESSPVKVIGIKGPWNHASVKKIKTILVANKIEAVLLQYSPASFKRSFRIKWAFTRFRGGKITVFHTIWGSGVDRVVGLLMLYGCKKIVATNSEVMFLIERYLPSLLRKTYWIPIGSNVSPLKKTHVPENGTCEPIISYFGMLYPGKGLDIILEVLAKLKRRGNIFHFKFLGGGMRDHGHYEREFHNRIKRLALDGSVEHSGLIPEAEVSKWLDMSRFVFLPYNRGLSDRRGSFMAAIAHGKAVLTSPPAIGMPFLKNGWNVLWPEEHAPHQYVLLFEKLLRDNELVLRLGKGAKALSRHFSWEKIAGAHEMVLRLGQSNRC